MEEVKWNSFTKKQNGLKKSNNEKSSTLPHEVSSGCRNQQVSPADDGNLVHC